MKCSVWNCRKKAVARTIIGPVCKKHYFTPKARVHEPEPITTDWSGFIEADRESGRVPALD